MLFGRQYLAAFNSELLVEKSTSISGEVFEIHSDMLSNKGISLLLNVMDDDAERSIPPTSSRSGAEDMAFITSVPMLPKIPCITTFAILELLSSNYL